MALKHPIKTTTNARSQTADTAALHLPPPHTFDILPPLYELLARVDRNQNEDPASSNETEGYHIIEGAPGDIGACYKWTKPPKKDNRQAQQDPQSQQDQQKPKDEDEEQPTGLQPLNPKDLPTAALEIKALIRNALREVEKLPDVDREVDEQEEEIVELEERVRKQREMLRGLAEVAKAMEGRMGG